MEKDESFGIIPLKEDKNGNYQALIIQHCAGHWGFPKGHLNKGEDPQTAAIRELEEETGLEIDRLLPKVPLQESYQFYKSNQRIDKTVLYFLALVTGTVKLQEEEVQNSLWLPINKLKMHVSFPEAKKLCQFIEKVLEKEQ